MAFPFFQQRDEMDCGLCCLVMISKYYGKQVSLDALKNTDEYTRDGVSLFGLREVASNIGFKARGVKLDFESLKSAANLPAVLHWDQTHFVVLPPQPFTKKNITIADPARGIVQISVRTFKESWIQIVSEQEGVALLLEPTEAFHNRKNEKNTSKKFISIYNYLLGYKKFYFQLVLGLLVGSLFQLILPFLAQNIVDTGINTKNLHFVYIIIIAQLALILGRTTVDFIRGRLLLYVSAKINLSILSDFWIKLMRLPLSYFEKRRVGDILQRIYDHERIEQFLTGSAIDTLFSFFNIVVFSVVLVIYNYTVFIIFFGGTSIYLFWVMYFLKHRRKLDYERFLIASRENSATLQLVSGMQEIKLNNAENYHRQYWEKIQISLFRFNYRSLLLRQRQVAGAVILNEGKNLLITFFVAQAVIQNQLTLGAMIAIQYIIGQLGSPIEQIITFIQQLQDTLISFERLNDIYRLKDEEPAGKKFTTILPQTRSITFNNVSFSYSSFLENAVLKKINLVIPENQVTAIVGMSGSGKTTLLKLLLKFYSDYSGEITVGNEDFGLISPGFWRSNCGSVMQESYIFNDTISANIAVGADSIERERLYEACTIANILEFVETLPLKFDTKIGLENDGLSQGQKQRILIARSIYKNPGYLFFDEATNSLDGNNESKIIENLKPFFQGKTVVIVAHRLSTVIDADNIVVLDQGEIVETGTHVKLTDKKGKYYQLVRNQLELGN